MITLDLIEAAEFLKMNPETLRRKSKLGEVPSRKTGKRWVFVKEHLADWISGRYPEHEKELCVTEEGEQQITKGKPRQLKTKRGLLTSPHQRAIQVEYDKLLGLKTNNKHKNCTTK